MKRTRLPSASTNATFTLRTRKTGRRGPEFKYRTAFLTPAMVAEIANLARHPVKMFGYAGRGTPAKMWDKFMARAGLPTLTRHEAGCHGFFTETVVRQGMDLITACDLGGNSPAPVAKIRAHDEQRRERTSCRCLAGSSPNPNFRRSAARQTPPSDCSAP